MKNYKNIHIGKHIKDMVDYSEIDIDRICKFFKCNSKEVEAMYSMKSLDTELSGSNQSLWASAQVFYDFMGS
jgi:hypothetical protein